MGGLVFLWGWEVGPWWSRMIRLVRFLDCWNTSRMLRLLRRWLCWDLAVLGLFAGGSLAQPAVESSL